MQSNYTHEVTIGAEAEFDLLIQRCQTDESGNVVFDDAGNTIPVGELRPVHHQKNLITDIGMNTLAGESFSPSSFHRNWGRRLNVGGGTTEPLPTDSTLTNLIAFNDRSEDSQYTLAWGTGDDVGKLVFTTSFTFGVGAAAGNISEVGLGMGTRLDTHALLKDGGGNPVVVVVAPDEQLVGVYRTKLQPNTADAVFNTNTSPTPQDYTLALRAANVGTGAISENGTGAIPLNGGMYVYTGAASGVGPVTGIPTGAQQSSVQSNGRVTTDGYVAGSFEKVNHFTLQPTDTNFADIGAMMFFGSLFSWQIGIVPRLTKVNPETIKASIKTTWSRI